MNIFHYFFILVCYRFTYVFHPCHELFSKSQTMVDCGDGVHGSFLCVCHASQSVRGNRTNDLPVRLVWQTRGVPSISTTNVIGCRLFLWKGLILSAFFIGYVAGNAPAGLLSYWFGPKLIFGIGVVGTGVLNLLIPLAASRSLLGNKSDLTCKCNSAGCWNDKSKSDCWCISNGHFQKQVCPKLSLNAMRERAPLSVLHQCQIATNQALCQC